MYVKGEIMRQVSPKQSQRLKEYRRVRDCLYQLNAVGNHGRSELSGKPATYSYNLGEVALELHHVCGRIGDKLCDPYGMILITFEEHRDCENNEYTKEELLSIVEPIRRKQGWER